MAKPKPGKKTKRTVSVNMEGVEAGGKAIADGNYEAEIVEVTEEESSNGNEQLKVVWQFTEKMKGTKLFDWLSLTPQSLWRLRGLLETIGVEVPDGVMNIDLDDLIGCSAVLEVTNEDYNGKKRPKVTGYGTIEAEAEGESEDESEESEESEEAESEDESEESEESEDEDAGESEDEDESEESDEAEEAEEEEEEEEKPKKPSGKKPSKPTKPEPKTTGKPKLKVGAEVKFKNDKGKMVKGTVTAKDGDTLQVEDTKGEEWELDASEVELA